MEKGTGRLVAPLRAVKDGRNAVDFGSDLV